MTVFWIILTTIIASAFFSGTEIAFVSANRLKIELDKSKGNISGQIMSAFLSKSSFFIAMLLFGNNIALVIYGMYMEESLIQWLMGILPPVLQNSFLILIIETILATLLILVFAEFIPKVLFRINANGILTVFAPLLYVLYYLLLPFVYMFIKVSEFVLHYILQTPIEESKYVFSSVDLHEYVKEFSSNTKTEESTEQDLQIFQNAIDFKDIKVRECMVPRTEINAIDIYNNIEELRKVFEKTGHSKILVYEDNIDNIIGYVHAYDLFKMPRNIIQIKRNMLFVPETMAANRLLSNMIKGNYSIATVLDEFGGTSGIVSMEDLMEEIFGEIEDEFDSDDLIEELEKEGVFKLSSRLEIDYLNEKYDFNFPEDDEYETIGGYIIHHYESIPQKGEEIIIDNWKFEILEASSTKIELVRLLKIEES